MSGVQVLAASPVDVRRRRAPHMRSDRSRSPRPHRLRPIVDGCSRAGAPGARPRAVSRWEPMLARRLAYVFSGLLLVIVLGSAVAQRERDRTQAVAPPAGAGAAEAA